MDESSYLLICEWIMSELIDYWRICDIHCSTFFQIILHTNASQLPFLEFIHFEFLFFSHKFDLIRYFPKTKSLRPLIFWLSSRLRFVLVDFHKKWHGLNIRNMWSQWNQNTGKWLGRMWRVLTYSKKSIAWWKNSTKIC